MLVNFLPNRREKPMLVNTLTPNTQGKSNEIWGIAIHFRRYDAGCDNR
jgi:hypothetical protein